MYEILLATSTGIHLFAAVVWIGGIFFILYVALPSARKTLEQPGALMGALGKRFVPLANLSILLIFVTGVFMSLSSHALSGVALFSTVWSQTLLAKIITALTMTCIHFYRGLILTRKIAKITAEGGHSEHVGRLQRMSLTLVKTNFVLGTTVILFTGILYAYRS